MRPFLMSLALSGVAGSIIAAEDPVAELLAQMKIMDQAVDLIVREHADPVDRDALWRAARAGMVTALDRDSAWLDRGQTAGRGGSDRSRREGYGFDWQSEDGLVLRVVPGAPAGLAGLKPGDRIQRIDDQPAATAVDRLANNPVRLTWTGGDGDGAATLRRGPFSDTGLSGPVELGDGIGLIRIHRFLADPPEPSAEAPSTPTALGLMISPRWRGLVLDLRGCGGGHLGAAVAAVGTLLPAGLPDVPVARQVSSNRLRDQMLTVTGSASGDPALVVLVDGATGSAAELMAAALRHQRKAVLAGTRTMGKDSVQQVFLMPEGDALLLTVAHLRDPAGTGWEHGLQPDVAITLDEPARLAGLRSGPTADPAIAKAKDLALAARTR